MAEGELQNRTAIVTGGASGIGRAIARRFAMEGANVVIADIDETAGSEVVEAIEDDDGVVRFVPADVTDARAVETMVETTVTEFGTVDVLVNNAGGTLDDDTLHRIDEATWDRNLELNLKAAFLCSRAVLPAMIEQEDGRLIHISSVNGLFGVGNTAYSAAKGGLLPLSKLIANQYGRYGIRSNVICPGEIDTGAHPHVQGDQELVEEWLDQFPLGRYGRPREVANVALFLASDESSYVSGTEIVVDGAMSAGPDHSLEVLSHGIDEL